MSSNVPSQILNLAFKHHCLKLSYYPDYNVRLKKEKQSEKENKTQSLPEGIFKLEISKTLLTS